MNAAITKQLINGTISVKKPLSVGMRHDEPYCPSTHIMSTSLGPGKVTWSSCSLRDYHAFLQRLELVYNNSIVNCSILLHI